MTAAAQGMAGLALVMGFALLCIRQVSAAVVLLAVQCAAVATSAVVLRHPAMAMPPLLLAAGAWVTQGRFTFLEARSVPVGGAKLGIGAGAVLAVMCQSQAAIALPLAVVLLSLLLAATRQHPLMHLIALVSLQNGIVLGACLINQPSPYLVLSCFTLPLPLAACILVSPPWAGKPAGWFGWVDVAVSLAIFAATLVVPLDPVASVFAPLLGIDAVMRSHQRRKRQGMPAAARGLALLTSALIVVAVCLPNLITAWLAVLAAMTTSVHPTMRRRRDHAVLAFLGAGVALLGLISLDPFIVGYFSLFAGFAAIAAVVPDLAAVLVILLLRLADQAPWPPEAKVLGIAIALAALLACAVVLVGRSPRSSVTVLQQSQASIAALAVCLPQADGRFAGLVLLILLILTRAAARVTDRPLADFAVAALGGVPPLGVFPGLVLVLLTIANVEAWLLLPVGAACVSILAASLPRRLPALPSAPAIPSAGWLPLAIALLAGYFAPEGLVRWWHVLAAGR